MRIDLLHALYFESRMELYDIVARLLVHRIRYLCERNIRLYEAYLYGLGMVCGSLTIAFLHHYLFYEFTRNGVALRTALTAKIFEKSLVEQIEVSHDDFMKSGSYLYLRACLKERWNTLNKFKTYPNMISPLQI